MLLNKTYTLTLYLFHLILTKIPSVIFIGQKRIPYFLLLNKKNLLIQAINYIINVHFLITSRLLNLT